MKKQISIFKSIFIASVSVLALSSCQGEEGWNLAGQAVRFTVGANGIDTKAAYSGATNSAGTIERIDWKSGDILRIHCEQASEPSDKFADYIVSSVDTPSSNSEVSTAHIDTYTPTSDAIGLRWGEGDHTFYAAFPSPVSSGAVTAINKNIISASIPATQAVIGTITKSGTSWKAAPDLKNMVMTAKAGPDTESTFPEDNEVFLNFTALTTAIEFTIKNDTGAALPLTSVQLISGNGKSDAQPVLNGAFSVDIDQTGIAANTEVQPFTGNSFKIKYMHSYPLCTSTAATSTNTADRTVSINVGTTSAPLTLAEDETLTFTFFLNPVQNLDDLTFKFVKSDGNWMSTRLGYTDGTGVFFPRHKKSFVEGLLIPDGAKWTVKYGPTVENWGTGTGSGGIDPMPPVDEALTLVTSWDSGVEGNLLLRPLDYSFKLTNAANAVQLFTNTTDSDTKTVSVTSTLTDNDGTESDKEWLIKSIKVGSADAQTVNANSFSDIGGLSATQVNNGHDLKITASGRTAVDQGSNAYWRNTAMRTESLGWSPEDWSSTKATSSAPLDLSKFDFQTETTNNPMTTANCYIVRHAGTYKIPLVYGNAIVNDATNEQAYKPTIASGGSNGLTPFVNHLGNGITSPFIENNKKSSSSYINAQAAAIVWQDKDAVIKDVKIVSGASTGTAGSYTTSNVRYLQFTVDPEKICQNNAIIAIKDGTGSNANTIWSWHIWTTNDPALLSDPIAVTNNAGTRYNFFPIYTLGWFVPTAYPERDQVTIVLEQADSKKALEITVQQSSIPTAPSSGVFYQWGRKDPIPSSDPTGFNKYSTSAASLKDAILRPDRFYYGSSRYNWCSSNYYNLWTGKYSSITPADQNNNMIKTIYDPSPIGYKVPASNAFTGFTTTDGTADVVDPSKFNVKGDYLYGWHFYTCKASSVDASTPTIYFAAPGYRYYDDGKVYYKGSYSSFWSAIPVSLTSGGSTYNYYGYHVDFWETSVFPLNINFRSYGFSVRPVTE